jgi:hypothetical protein
MVLKGRSSCRCAHRFNRCQTQHPVGCQTKKALLADQPLRFADHLNSPRQEPLRRTFGPAIKEPAGLKHQNHEPANIMQAGSLIDETGSSAGKDKPRSPGAISAVPLALISEQYQRGAIDQWRQSIKKKGKEA